jgi:hypothetical protein
VNTGEITEVWTWEARDVPSELRRLADAIESTPGLLLLSFTNTPEEPSDPWLFCLQAVVTRDPEASS